MGLGQSATKMMQILFNSFACKWHELRYFSFTEAKRPRVQQTDRESSPADEGRDISVVYVCELPEVKGRFDIEKARNFFNRAGPHYGLLQAGKSVMSHDGVTMVRFQHGIVVIINMFRVRVMSA